MAVPKAQSWRLRVRFRMWRKGRPFWGAILMMLAGLLILWGPASLLQLAMLPGNSIWAGLLVGALLFVMGLIQLLAPSYALITGAIGIVLSLISLIVALGGLGIGMLLGIIGGSLGVAWRPVVRPSSLSDYLRPPAPIEGRRNGIDFNLFYQKTKDRSKTLWNNLVAKIRTFQTREKS
ncbi:MAG: hypothetical protein JO031_01195 [Ktedonobacteraceae bacterium]|nr:hypothetical protein [Ktedonobacteraceae bacterium]